MPTAWSPPRVKDEGAAFLLVQVLVGEFERAGPEVSPREMNSQLWAHLPSEILELVLSLLPVRSKHRLRSVSKAWKASLCSSDVLKGPNGVVPRLCGFQFLRQQEPASFGQAVLAGEQGEEQEVKQLLRLDLSFLPSRFQGWPSYAVDNGFVVLSDMPSFLSKSSRSNFCIFNPMMRTWRELPPLVSSDLYFLSSVSVAYSESDGLMELSVVCRQAEFDNPMVAVYCPHAKQWDVGEVEEGSSEERLLVSGRVLYYVGFHEEVGEAVLVFDLNNGQFEQLQAVAVPEVVSANVGHDDSFVAKHADTMYLVVDLPVAHYSTGVIWKLCASSQTWAWVSSIPEELLAGGDFIVDEVKVVGDYICVRSMDGLYAYSIFDNTWKVFDRHRVRDYMVPNLSTAI